MIKASELKKTTQKGAREVFMASLGVVALANDTSQKVFASLVEKGRAQQKTNTVKDKTNATASKVLDFGKAMSQKVESQVRGVLSTLGLPSSNEIQELSHRVQELTQRVNQLSPATKKA